MIAANGENRRWVASVVGYALLAAVGTKLGEWVIAELQHRYGTKPKPGEGKP